ncbi:MAG: hypothetical protein KIT33_15610 [Candidatus Kapabacteria bacterium]|nr:hypothetical protein [Ignavibacteriota bacterium]MCW5886397.1 hypothetical protein [Candidatus Kapabacteria bacterium]
MTFDNGTWWLVAGIGGVMVLSLGFLLTLTINTLIVKPGREFRDAVSSFNAAISDFKTFIEVQKVHNVEQDKDTLDIYTELDKHDTRITKVENYSRDQRHEINAIKQILDYKQEKY